MNKNVLIVNYNTTLLTQCCIKSVNKFTPGCKIYVFDNSDKEPFVNIFENVNVIDNTKGEIIDFEKWLEKYPNRFKSGGKRNNFGSAKHCFSVEKAMEIIKEPFVLLDSDVLLKRDFSSLFDENYFFIGETKVFLKNTYRLLPFICYINTIKCKEKNIHYFDENHMHGLYTNNGSGECYDTGGWFLQQTKDFLNKKIKVEDYIEHFNAGSWLETHWTKPNDPSLVTKWLNKFENLWKMENKINICIVHFNTPKLTECLIKSINKFVPSCKIYIFDNSDKEPFVYKQDNIVYFDNTKGEIIDFEKWLSGFKEKVASGNKWASAKHCYTIQKCMELINEPFILLDSDVLLKKDISDLFDEKYVYVADIEKWQGNERVIPYCCFINTKMCKENNVNYFNEKYIVGLSSHCKYDTGANFYLECKNLPCKKISYKEYVVHMDDGSQRYSAKYKQENFLKTNKKLWDNDNFVIKKEEINVNNTINSYKKRIERIGKNYGINFNIDNPQTIQDKIQWLKLYDSTPLKTRCADKIKVHDYCKEKLGKDICIPILKIYNNTNEINWDELPQQFVIKCNHGSGMNIIVKDKKTMNKTDVIEKLNKWMVTDFAFQNGCELHYHGIEHKIFVEKYEEDSKQKNSLFDYKFWCFNGEPKMYTINSGFGHGDILYYKMNHEIMNPYCVEVNDSYVKPKNFDLMVEYSKKLCQDFKFVRVDFYEINNEVYLGELTFTPGSGIIKYKNNKYDKIFGDMLDIHKEPNKVKNKKVVYTCISGNYDTLLEPEFISEGFDYVCFTDQPFTSNIWKIRPIPEELNNLSGVKRQRNIKINAHKYLSEYDFSVWVDANTTLKGDINKYVEKNCGEKDVVLWIGKHPSRDCIYKEGDMVVKIKYDTKENVDTQLNVYKKEGFPEHYGLPQSCIILRYHNDEQCKKLMETWWEQVEKYSHRDQLSFNYALWKNQDVKVEYLDKSIFDCETFKWGVTHKKAKFTNKKQSTTEKIPKINEVKIPHTSNTPTHSVEEKKKTLRERIEEIRAKRERKINGPNYFGEY